MLIENAGKLRVTGSLPLVLVAASSIDILGILDASSSGRAAHAGGFVSSDGGTGGGPGGGSGGSPHYNGGAGGSFCGAGGIGGVEVAPAWSPGTSGGASTIIPLRGGSAGGGGLGGSQMGLGGAGGGALQLVAGTSITVGAGGSVNVGGGGGTANGGAGGSGGSLLLESPTIEVLGALAANGGGGAIHNGGASGQDGRPTSAAAQGSEATAGYGSASTTINGADGSITSGDPNSSGGGGGGAGWIRLNTASGTAKVTGVVSPALTTSCVSQGKITQ